MNRTHIISYCLLYCLVSGCVKHYNPPPVNAVNHFLVVEGVINTNDSTIIKLSRSVNLASDTNYLPEPKATISIQDNQSQSYPLKELGNGVYSSAVLNLDNTHKYRLNITTSDGKNYQSDYVVAMATPPIDSIGYTIKSNGLQIYVNTHDPKNSTHYYHWDYNETWIFHAEYFSSYITNDSTDVVYRPVDKQIYKCWSSDISNYILLGSSAKLTQDVIYQSPITFIPSTSEKIELRYSILLKQYALTSDAYNYYTLLKTNTEQLGSIFDAQPSELIGNIHCTSDPSLRVIGYISASTIQQKRVFIDNAVLPRAWAAIYPYDCEQDTALYFNPKTMQNDVLRDLVIPGGSQVTTSAIYANGPNPIGYLYSDPDCADCSIRGTLIQPSFWQ